MSDCRKKLIAALLCLWSFEAFPQSAMIKVLIAGDDSAISDAIIIIKPLSDHSSRKQQILFTDNNGGAANTISTTSSILIHKLGFKDVNDTIEPGQSSTFHLEHSTYPLNDVVVTGQYDINTSDKSVYNVKVIDDKTIRQMAAKNLTDVLTNQLNMRLSQDNLLGSSVAINGISGQNVKILVDGVNVIGRENGNVDLSQINMNNVERIEIIEGPMSVSYGTDALGGLINIVTKKANSYPLEGDVHLYYESVGTYNADASLFFKQNNHSFALSGGRYFFDGYSDPDTSRYQDWKPTLQYFGTFNYNYSGHLLNVGVKSEYFNEEIQNKGMPVLSPYQAYAFDDYYFTRRLNEALFIEKRLKNNASIQLTNAYNNYRHIKNTYRIDLVTLQQQLAEGEGIQDTSVFDEWSLRGTYNSTLPSRKLNFQTGYDINLQSGTGENLAPGIRRIDDYAAFGSLEYEMLRNFYVRPGARIAYNTRYGAPLTPSLNLKYDLNDRYTFRAAYAHGFRAPSLKELDLSFVDANHNIHGNDSLKAETSDNFSASFTATKDMSGNKLKTDLSFFYNNINNQITLVLVNPTINEYTYANISKYKTRGVSFTGTFAMKNFSVCAGVSLLDLYNALSDSFDIEKFSLTPEFQTDMTFTIPKAGVDAAVFFKSTGSTPGYNIDAQGNLYETFLAAYTMMDVSVTKYLWKKHVAIAAGVKNLFDVSDLRSNSLDTGFHSANTGSVPYATGRFFFASLRIKLFKE